MIAGQGTVGPRHDEEDIDSDGSAGKQRDPGVIGQERKHGDGAHAFDVGAEGTTMVGGRRRDGHGEPMVAGRAATRSGRIETPEGTTGP